VRRFLPIARLGASSTQACERSGATKSKLAPMHEPIGKVLDELKRVRGELEKAAFGQTSLTPAIRALRHIELRLERPLRVAIIGEFNSGKSTLTNLLVRIESLPTAVVSNTCIPTLLYHAAEPEVWAVYHDRRREWLRASSHVSSQDIFRLEVGLPSERLRAIQILDLPGLADARFDGSIADLPFHIMDAAVWCTLSTQAWKESERAAWEQLPQRLRGRGLLVATHCDLLRDPGDLVKLLCRLQGEAGSSFRNILPMSTIEALGVMQEDHDGPARAIWKASGADALETALDELLLSIRRQRLQAALKVTGRIADHTLLRIASPPLPPEPRRG
jgi:energy-coupling factor transporter ATP-binding protein EcfA2